MLAPVNSRLFMAVAVAGTLVLCLCEQRTVAALAVVASAVWLATRRGE